MNLLIKDFTRCCFVVLLTLCLLCGCNGSKKRELAAVDEAIAANNYELQQFNSDTSQVTRFAEGFAKSYDGDLGGVARDAAAIYSRGSQLEENDRRLRARRAQIVASQESGISIFPIIMAAFLIIGFLNRNQGKAR